MRLRDIFVTIASFSKSTLATIAKRLVALSKTFLVIPKLLASAFRTLRGKPASVPSVPVKVLKAILKAFGFVVSSTFSLISTALSTAIGFTLILFFIHIITEGIKIAADKKLPGAKKAAHYVNALKHKARGGAQVIVDTVFRQLFGLELSNLANKLGSLGFRTVEQ